MESELGKIYQVIPWNDLIKLLKLKKPRKGRGAYFSPQGTGLDVPKSLHWFI